MEQPNQTYINALCEGDETFKQKLIAIIKKEFPIEKKEYYTNFNSKKYKQAASNVHKIKHKISILGLEKSYAVTTTFENNLLESKTALYKEFDSILSVVTNYLEQL